MAVISDDIITLNFGSHTVTGRTAVKKWILLNYRFYIDACLLKAF